MHLEIIFLGQVKGVFFLILKYQAEKITYLFFRFLFLVYF